MNKMYNTLSSTSKLSFNEYINDDANVMHNKLYAYAIDQLMGTLPYVKIYYKYVSGKSVVYTNIELTNPFNLVITRNGKIINDTLSNISIVLRCKDIESMNYKISKYVKFIDDNDKSYFYSIINSIINIKENNLTYDKLNELECPDKKVTIISKESILKIEEIPNSNYLASSDIIIIYKSNNTICKQKVNLLPYWNNQFLLNQKYKYNQIKVDDYTIKSGKIIKIDYVNAKILVYSQITENKVWLPFAYANEYMKLDDSLKLTNIFS